MPVPYKRVKVSKHDDAPPIKRDGYAAGSVPKHAIGVKEGKTPKKPYSGPNVAQYGRME